MAEIYRKRLIPEECIHLHKDKILFNSDGLMVTRWDTINPKAAFSKGISLYVMEKGWKISKFFDAKGNFVYWYCDIIDTVYDEASDTYVFTDLLADVIIEPTGKLRVVDLDEYTPAFEKGLIDTSTILLALRRLNDLLTIIDDGSFKNYTKIVESYE
ncbi:MAG: DUF402 domain-containing protein [Lachnospiraceae bacterium]